MARKPRVYYPGALYHVTLRGNAGQAIFFDNRDRTRFYLLLQEGIERFRYRIHAFCLMSNHVHLAIQVGDIPLSRIMQNLSFRYTRWINWRQNRSGHLFQGRYKAVLVDADAYLLELTRYIHLNPVRAGIVKEPEEYPWSGHRAYLGNEVIPWLTTDWVLSQFSKRVGSARRAYGRFIRDGKKGGYRKEYRLGSGTDSRILGDDEFIDRVLEKEEKRTRRRVGLDRILREVCKTFSLGEKKLLLSIGFRGQVKGTLLTKENKCFIRMKIAYLKNVKRLYVQAGETGCTRNSVAASNSTYPTTFPILLQGI